MRLTQPTDYLNPASKVVINYQSFNFLFLFYFKKPTHRDQESEFFNEKVRNVSGIHNISFLINVGHCFILHAI